MRKDQSALADRPTTVDVDLRAILEPLPHCPPDESRLDVLIPTQRRPSRTIQVLAAIRA
jgi:hypothetical protein